MERVCALLLNATAAHRCAVEVDVPEASPKRNGVIAVGHSVVSG